MQFGFKNYKIIKNERNFTGSKPRSSSSSSEAFLLYNKACPNEPTRQQSQNKAYEIVSRKTHIRFITLHYSLTLFYFVSSSSKSFSITYVVCYHRKKRGQKGQFNDLSCNPTRIIVRVPTRIWYLFLYIIKACT